MRIQKLNKALKRNLEKQPQQVSEPAKNNNEQENTEEAGNEEVEIMKKIKPKKRY